MRIFLTSIDNPYFGIGGKHTHLLLLERALGHLKQDTVAYYPKPKVRPVGALSSKTQPASVSKKLRQSVLYLFYLFLKNQGIKEITDVYKQQSALKPIDIIHCHDVVSLLAFKNIKNCPKKILTLHGYYSREAMSDLKGKVTRKLVYNYCFSQEKEAMKLADFVITVDFGIKDYIIETFAYPPDKIIVMPNAVDIDVFKPVSESEMGEAKKSIGFNSDDFIVLVPRRLVKKNGVIYAIRAVNTIGDDGVKMIIAGDGPEKEAISKELQNADVIKLLGTVPYNKISFYYQASDAIVIPSITTEDFCEATSLSMLEAMACAKPVIASDIGGLKETINNGKTGILINEKDSEAIKNAILKIKNNKKLAVLIGESAARYVNKNHSYLEHANRVLEIYDKLR